MSRLLTITLVATAGFSATASPEKFFRPDGPFLAATTDSPSPKVTNGTAFETGVIPFVDGQTLRLPENAVVEEHDGPQVQLFVTKSLRFSGHPPREMDFQVTRSHFGVAQRILDGVIDISTFGEWANPDGAAKIRLLVLAPRSVQVVRSEGLSGNESEASSKFSPSDEAFSDSYWYAGPRPGKDWKAVPTSLYYGRFLKPY